MKPKFIYFDLGNVLLHFDHAIACQRIASDVGLTPETVRGQIFDTGLQHQFESGELTPPEFVEAFCTATGCQIEPERMLRYCSDIFTLNACIVPIVCQLKMTDIRLGILSNTCQAHWEFVARGRFTLLQRFFKTYILSYEVGAMKPASAIYESAISHAECSAEEIFFVDDLRKNVEGARAAGIDAEQFTDISTLIRHLTARQVFVNA